MYTITASAPDFALEAGLWYLRTAGIVGESRNGRVLRAPGPVCTAWPDPTKRVMFSPLRDANPFFHLFESIWMLAGRNDAASLAVYNSHMATFAENGTFWGAYGHRWLNFFGFDQLAVVIDRLKSDPNDRRVVLSMWAPYGDLVPCDDDGSGGNKSRDLPCNTAIYFDAGLGQLNMTVTNRSNDIVWGAYGANVVHMSFLHEFVALATGIPLGTYYQFSNNYHAYIDRPDVARLIDTQRPRESWAVNFVPRTGYTLGVKPRALLQPDETRMDFLDDASAFFEGGSPLAATDFFAHVAAPLRQAFEAYKADDFGVALARCRECLAEDWRYAAVDWLVRRLQGRVEKGQVSAGEAAKLFTFARS